MSVDGHLRKNWADVLTALDSEAPKQGFANYSAFQHGLRASERLNLADVPNADLPAGGWRSLARIGIQACYHSIFHAFWTVDAPRIGRARLKWNDQQRCPAQPGSIDF